MLEKIRIQHYKSLYDVTIEFAPLTAFIGPNGSGKSNICEAIYFLSKLVEGLEQRVSKVKGSTRLEISALTQVLGQTLNIPNFQNKFWRGKDTTLQFSITILDKTNDESYVTIYPSNSSQEILSILYFYKIPTSACLTVPSPSRLPKYLR